MLLSVQNDIVRLKEVENWTWENIARAVDKKKSTVRQFYCRYKANKDLPPKVVIKKSMIDGSMGVLIKRTLSDRPKASLSVLKGVIAEKIGGDKPVPSKETIRRYLKAADFGRVTLVKKPLLRDVNKQKRLDFATLHEDMGIDWANSIIWSDETMVRSYPQNRKIEIWLPNSVPIEERPSNSTVQHGGISVMFWGAFSFYGWGPLVVMEGKINSAKYLEILKQHLVPFEETMPVDGIFMQDNASIHKTPLVMDYLAEKGIDVLEWPPQSPDMNPIENVWAEVKRKLYEKDSFSQTKAKLIEDVFEIWENLKEEYRANLSASIIRRIYICKEREGGWTGY